MKKIVFLILISFLILIMASCSKKNKQDEKNTGTQDETQAVEQFEQKYAPDSAVVIVNDEPILFKDIEPFMKAVIEQELTRWQMTYNSETPDNLKKELYESVQGHIIEQSIIDKLLLQSAKKNTILITDDEINKEVEMIKSQTTDTAGHSTFNSFLEKMGFSDEKMFKGKIKDKLMVMKYSQKTLETNPEYSDPYLKDYYEKNKDLFRHSERRKVQHILMTVDSDSTADESNIKFEKIKEAQKKLKSGKKFEDVAVELSECESRANGGFIGYLEVTGNENDTLSLTAAKLQKNQLSEIIKTERGYHIVKVPEIQKSYVDDFEKVRNRL